MPFNDGDLVRVLPLDYSKIANTYLVEELQKLEGAICEVAYVYGDHSVRVLIPGLIGNRDWWIFSFDEVELVYTS